MSARYHIRHRARCGKWLPIVNLYGLQLHRYHVLRINIGYGYDVVHDLFQIKDLQGQFNSATGNDKAALGKLLTLAKEESSNIYTKIYSTVKNSCTKFGKSCSTTQDCACDSLACKSNFWSRFFPWMPKTTCQIAF